MPPQHAAENADSHAHPLERIYDDDDVIVPAPATEDFLPRRPAVRIANRAPGQSQFFRRTIIPIMLTLGALLPILGSLWFITDETSPFRRLHIALPIALIALGSMLLVLGILNAFYLKHQIQQQSKR